MTQKLFAFAFVILFPLLTVSAAEEPEKGPGSLRFKILDIDGEKVHNAILYSIWKQIDEIPADVENANTEHIWGFWEGDGRLYWTDSETNTHWKRYHDHSQHFFDGGGGPADAIQKAEEVPYGTYRVLGSNIRNGGMIGRQENHYALSKPVTLDETNKDAYFEFPVEKKGGTLEVFLVDPDSSEMIFGARIIGLAGTPLPDLFIRSWLYAQGDSFAARVADGNKLPVPHTPATIRWLPAGEYTFRVMHPLTDRYFYEVDNVQRQGVKWEPNEKDVAAAKEAEPNLEKPVIDGEEKTYTATIREGETTRVVVYLKPQNRTEQEVKEKYPFVLNGTVKDEQGNPIKDAMVEIYRPGLFDARNWHNEFRPCRRTWTDAEGKYSFRFNPQTILSTISETYQPRAMLPPEADTETLTKIAVRVEKDGWYWSRFYGFSTFDDGKIRQSQYESCRFVLDDGANKDDSMKLICVRTVWDGKPGWQVKYDGQPVSEYEMLLAGTPKTLDFTVKPAVVIRGKITFDKELDPTVLAWLWFERTINVRPVLLRCGPESGLKLPKVEPDIDIFNAPSGAPLPRFGGVASGVRCKGVKRIYESQSAAFCDTQWRFIWNAVLPDMHGVWVEAPAPEQQHFNYEYWPMPIINRTETFTTPAEPGVYDLTLRWTTVTNPQFPGATVKQLQVVSFTDASGNDRSDLFSKPGTTPAATPLDYLFRRWTITGTIKDADGQPVVGGHVSWPLEFYFTDKERESFRTDENGRYELTFWPSVRRMELPACGEVVQIHTGYGLPEYVFLQDTPEDRPRPEELNDRWGKPVSYIVISGEPLTLDFKESK